MKTVLRGLFAISFAATVITAAGCGFLKKKDEDAGADDAAAAAVDPDAAAAAATPPPAALPAATNVDDIARFPDETKLENVAATIQRFSNAREVPVSGKVVSALGKGTAVTQIAQRKEFFLVVFDNPKDATKKLMGWVPADSFTAAPAVDAGVLAIKCEAGQTALIGDTAFCGKVCASDLDCPNGQACKGASNKLVNGKSGEAVRVCTVFATAADAGVPIAKPVDAGAPPPPPPAGDIIPPQAGGCPGDFALVAKDGQCHKRCRNAGACTTAKSCVKCSGVSVCAVNDAFCK